MGKLRCLRACLVLAITCAALGAAALRGEQLPSGSPPVGWAVMEVRWYPIAGAWNLTSSQAELESAATPAYLAGGASGWSSCHFSVLARKTGGEEGFLVLLRLRSPSQWIGWNVGGWGNTQSALVQDAFGSAQPIPTTVTTDRVETGRVYRLDVIVEGTRLRCFLDGAPKVDYTLAENDPHTSGQIGLAAWSTTVVYSNWFVTSLTGVAASAPAAVAIPPEPADVSQVKFSDAMLGSRWIETEGAGQEWHGVWTRTPGTRQFEARWTHPKGWVVQANIEITSMAGRAVVLQRIDTTDPTSCSYRGTLQNDGVTIKGEFQCIGADRREWRGEWRATIMK